MYKILNCYFQLGYKEKIYFLVENCSTDIESFVPCPIFKEHIEQCFKKFISIEHIIRELRKFNFKVLIFVTFLTMFQFIKLSIENVDFPVHCMKSKR